MSGISGGGGAVKKSARITQAGDGAASMNLALGADFDLAKTQFFLEGVRDTTLTSTVYAVKAVSWAFLDAATLRIFFDGTLSAARTITISIVEFY
jgi:hypothetical protein